MGRCSLRREAGRNFCARLYKYAPARHGARCGARGRKALCGSASSIHCGQRTPPQALGCARKLSRHVLYMLLLKNETTDFVIPRPVRSPSSMSSAASEHTACRAATPAVSAARRRALALTVRTALCRKFRAFPVRAELFPSPQFYLVSINQIYITLFKRFS